MAGSIEVRDLRVERGSFVLEVSRLSVRPREVFAILGSTGSGKTVLMESIAGAFPLDGGCILLDGKDVESLPVQQRHLGILYQDYALFPHMTVRENIAYGRPDATEQEVIAAAKAAHADSFIRRLPQGYDTPLTGGGAGLSQGQRQLLCIARVMLRRPPILILDEATSSIDTRTEVLVQDAFEELMKGRTSFIVAHRLSTIKNADQILVMKDGNIIERGTHETLLARGGFYKQLYESQFAKA